MIKSIIDTDDNFCRNSLSINGLRYAVSSVYNAAFSNVHAIREIHTLDPQPHIGKAC